MENNVYLKQIHNAFPRLLSLFDTDPYSLTYGVGNRFYWGWKLIDFGNGTFQGAANCLARLLKNDLLPPIVDKRSIERRINEIFRGANCLRRANGSMEEAFPHESSFCVTALVAYDLLTSMELQKMDLSEDEWNSRINVVKPMIEFLCKKDETHAFISNHLATAVAALYKWHALTNDLRGKERGRFFLNRILANMSDEGWFKEYEGADPGYQTLCMYYLTDVYRILPIPELKDALYKSIRFLWHFAHPDGSFGGEYGSRNTRFYYPTAFEYFKDELPEAKILAVFMRKSIQELRTVTLDSMDEPNLIPMLNAYTWAAALSSEKDKEQTASLELPALCRGEQQVDFFEAGIHIRGTEAHYTIIAIHKGGVVSSFSRDGFKSNIDAGNVIRYKGKLYSTQVSESKSTFSEEKGEIITEVQPVLMLKSIPKPWQFAILRTLNCTLMRNQLVNELIKKILVKMLITGKKKLDAKVQRKIILRGDIATVDVAWKQQGDKSLPVIETPRQIFRSIHMASSGYWQRGDD